MNGCYLLHFSKPTRNGAMHYIGLAKDIDKRIAKHRKGNGARIVAQLMQEGGTFVVARIWPGADHWDEIRLKAQRNHKKYCPLCGGDCD